MKLPQSLKKKIVLLKQKKYRDQYGEFVIEGIKMVEEAIKSGQAISSIIIQESIEKDFKIKELLKKIKTDIYLANEKDFKQISSLETPPGILAVLKKRKERIDGDKTILILDSIKDPGNLGTIIRTADWFGFENIIMGKGTADIYNTKVLQSTMGSIFHVNFIEDEDLFGFIKNLKAEGYKIIATALEGENKKPVLKNEKFAIVMGSETFGINKEILKFADLKYKITGTGKAESLNVAVATGIVLFEFSSK